MIPDNFYLGGGATETTISLIAVFLLLTATVAILALPQKYVVVPVLLAVIMIPRGEVLVVAGCHLNPGRLISLVGLARLTWTKFPSGEKTWAGRLNSIDNAYFWCVACGAMAFVLLWRQMDAVINQAGIILGAFGMYYLLRALIRDEEDIYRVAKVFVVVVALNAFGMVYEQLANQNLFGMLIGGVDPIPLFRDGKIRSQGVFGHAILAGTFAATALPLFFMLWQCGKSKILAAIGVVSSVVMVYTCASSTPSISIVGGVMALCFWPVRKEMRKVRWAIVGILLIAQIFMKAPVWFLISHMEVVGASSGWHRAELVDVFIRHFFDWWLVGTKDAGNWGFGMFDTSNWFVAKGEVGGLLTFIFFIALISRSFGLLGKMRASVEGNSEREWMMWFLCATLFAHIIGFFGISYWDQNEWSWCAFLAIVCVATAPILKPKSLKEPHVEADLVSPGFVFPLQPPSGAGFEDPALQGPGTA